MWSLYVDGAARGNPGDAGIGIYIEKAGHPHYEGSFYIGTKTNNQAEYCALIVGIYYLSRMMNHNDSVTIYTDSQLLAKQVRGEYRVKKAWLQTLYQRAITMLSNITSYAITHIPRDDNRKADQLANYAIDAYNTLPESLEYLCRS